jgi:arginyl-tRNA synthetase
MNIFKTIKSSIVTILKDVLLKDVNIASEIIEEISVERPKDDAFGDISTNVAMVLAKPLKMSPKKIAEELLPRLEGTDWAESVSIAGPGFINITLVDNFFWTQFKNVYDLGDNYGNCLVGQNKKVNIEYVSTNPTGPMHIGHTRGAVYGDVLAALMKKCGYEVSKEFYVNDAGGQIDTLAQSAYLRYLEVLNGEKVDIPDGLYPGEYLCKLGEELHKKFGSKLRDMSEAQRVAVIKPLATEAMIGLIKEDLAGLGVQHDVFTYETALHKQGAIEHMVQALGERGYTGYGTLPPPRGYEGKNWTAREQLLFLTTKFGDDLDRALTKADGSWTYLAADLAYLKHKIDRGYDELIVVMGADHAGYVSRLAGGASAISGGRVSLHVRLYQLVNYMKNGSPLKMSKRAGTYASLADILELVGKDVIRFIMLTRQNDVILDFDIDKVTEQSKDNPVFYVQYAHARACSLLRNVQNVNPHNANFARLNSKEEKHLSLLVLSWPRVVEMAVAHFEPHRVVFYLQDLAYAFHSLWNKGKEDANFRFIITDDEELTLARASLVLIFKQLISVGLKVMGVEPLDRM